MSGVQNLVGRYAVGLGLADADPGPGAAEINEGGTTLALASRTLDNTNATTAIVSIEPDDVITLQGIGPDDVGQYRATEAAVFDEPTWRLS